MPEKFSKWVACWGNATSITDRKEATYAKDLTLRYPIRACFSGSKLRFHFSNLTGTESVQISEAYVAKSAQSLDAAQSSTTSEKPASISAYSPCAITFGGRASATIPAGEEILSDEIAFDVTAGEDVSLYFADFTQMNAGTAITGPLSGGKYSYGNFAKSATLPDDLTRKTNWIYFLNTIDIFTEEKNFALVCFGDSITAQDWPDYLTLRCAREGFNNVAIIRRAVSGTRILREYSCITYAAYGLKGATRFPIEMNVAGARTVIVQHGINDIIHPVGVEVNKFRPWSDMPTADDLINGVRSLYITHARKLGLKIYSGTLLPIYGWRTYNENRDIIRTAFNEWLRTAPDFDGCVDFDKAVRGHDDPKAFAAGFDSGDHLHPSAKAYEAMAECVPEELLQ
ncbi:SGNH/GDSL hydrolase family protein [uncultured Fibrobacter sp.]|uniref:SGNH/GDSL hydrolase family protein n=1 Tax=uncultured Fibrobacter sp. TaxID=261512 RepID=UPI0025E171E8|nr:SGNH/GDSL hydrolase family protein [uncultured Fibrobacter sp.]